MSSTENSPSGADLARVALRAAIEVARKNGGGRPRARRRAPPAPEPNEAGASHSGSAPPSKPCSPNAPRWTVIAPDLAENVAAVGYDADTGCLTLSPRTPVWATETRLRQAQIIEAANTAAGRTVVRVIRVLAPSTGPAPTAAPATAADGGDPAAPVPVLTRETASPGYRTALRAHQQAAPARRIDHDVLEADRRAGERQAAAMRALSHRAFSDEVPRP